MLIIVLGGSLAVVGYPAAGAPRRQLDGGPRTHPARPATAVSRATTTDPPAQGSAPDAAPSHSPRQPTGNPATSASRASQDPQPTAAPSATSGRDPTTGKPPARAPAPHPSATHRSTGHAGGHDGTSQAAPPPSQAGPTLSEAPMLRQQPRAPAAQSIEPEAAQSPPADDLPVPTPATQPAGPSAAAALPVDNRAGGSPTPMDQPLTLIWSGMFALALAVTGVTMVVRRRRQW